MNYQFHPEAELELNEVALRFELEMPGLGFRFVDEVDRAIQLLCEHPELGSPVNGEMRHFVLRRFPFSIVYAVTPGDLVIVAIAHGSRRPGYWRTRAEP